MAQLIKEVQTVKQYAEKVDAQNEILRESNATLHADYALLEEKYYTLDAVNTKLNAEIHALTQEIERTNRHINLAENQLHREQSVERTPTVVNHYHNCVINK